MNRWPWVLVLLGVLVTPTVAAHYSTYSDARSVRAGPYSVTLLPEPSPLYEGRQLVIRAYAYGGGFDEGPPDYEGTMVLETSGTRLTLPMTGTPQRSTEPFVFPHAGNWTAHFHLRTQDANHSGTTTFDVYPDVGFVLRPADASADVVAQREARLDFLTADPDTGEPVSRVTDLRVRAEHWTDDHRTFLGAVEIEFQPAGAAGAWTAHHAFDRAGMWHLWFASASGNLSYYQAPMWHVTAAKGVGDAASTPYPPALAVLALVSCVAWARERSRRGRHF